MRTFPRSMRNSHHGLRARRQSTFPVYYEWSFRTGENEDFESLVKLLQPRPMDPQVGIRDMDASQPGFGMTVGADIGKIPPPEKPQTLLGLEGALKAPTTVSRPQETDIDTSKPFFAQLKSILNFPADVQDASDGDDDPVVSPPIYGENHAIQHRIDPAGAGWLNFLNRDPRFRVPSGFGTSVIQKNQEDYVARAWEQVKKILAANRIIIRSVFAMETVRAIQTNFVQRLAPAEMLAVFAPVMKKVKGSPTTLFHQLTSSVVPPAALNSAMRRMIRPRGAYGKRLRAANASFNHGALVQDLNSGRISAAPPKQVSDSVITDERIAEQLPNAHEPAWLQWVLTHRLLLLVILLVIALVIGLVGVWWLALDHWCSRRLRLLPHRRTRTRTRSRKIARRSKRNIARHRERTTTTELRIRRERSGHANHRNVRHRRYDNFIRDFVIDRRIALQRSLDDHARCGGRR